VLLKIENKTVKIYSDCFLSLKKQNKIPGVFPWWGEFRKIPDFLLSVSCTEKWGS
jgi:hypothetical protein